MKQVFVGLILILVATLLYIVTIRGYIGNPLIDTTLTNISNSPGPFESSHERAPYALTVSLVENNSFNLSKELADFASPDTVFEKNNYFIIFPPGMSFLITPFYSLGKTLNLAQIFSFGGMIVFALGNLLTLFYISKKILKLPNTYSLIPSIIFGFATTSWSYASSLYQHHVITFLILSSFVAIWKYKTSNRINWIWTIWVWVSFGFSVWLDYPSTVLFLPIIIYLIISSISINSLAKSYNCRINLTPLITSFIFLIIILAHAFYNQSLFGNWNRIAQLLPRYDTKILNEVKDVETKNQISQAEKTKSIEGVLQEKQLIKGIYTLSIAPDKGLLFFSPILLLALPGVYYAFKKQKKRNYEYAILLGLSLLNIFFYSSWGDPWGGWAYGPRYLIPTQAMLSLFIPIWIYYSRHKFIAFITSFILFGYSLGVALLGSVTTTATPPKIEADFLNLKYGYFLNWDFFLQEKTGSFIYTTYLSNQITLQTFSLVIFSIILVTFSVTLFFAIFKTNVSN